MKILVFGAGVIGCIYATKLFEAGYNVVLLARGKRYEDLKQHRVIIKDSQTGILSTSNIALTQELKATDFFDLIIVTVRLDQLDEVIPILKKNRACPLVMFMLNNPQSVTRLVDELDPMHIILGFPGTGGAYHDQFINYIQIKEQKTTIGEIDGTISICTREIKVMLEKAKFEVEISPDIQGWLKIHAVFLSCIGAAMIKENGDSMQLSKERGSVEIMVKSIREGFSACKALGLTIKPTNLKIIFMIMPLWFGVLYWQKALKGKLGILAIAPHVNAARDEMQLLAKRVLTLVHSSTVLTPTLDKLLLSFI